MQPLPDMKKFWSVLENKINFQDYFVKYCYNNYKGSKPLYLAGGTKSSPHKCMVISNGKYQEASHEEASHEEADDRMMFSINQIYSSTSHPGTKTVTVVSQDTDIFLVLLYHLKNSWKGLQLFFLRKGTIKGGRKQQWELHPLHLLLNNIKPEVVDNLPAGHALTGCDTVAKVGTKAALLKCLESDLVSLLKDFGKDCIDEESLSKAEEFLVAIVAGKKEKKYATFDELRLCRYHHQSVSKDLTDLPCTSNALQENIKRAYVQTKMWLESPFGNAMDILDLELYGYEKEADSGSLSPKMFDGPSRPLDVPPPCKCTNCKKKTCQCRMSEMPCIQFCSCMVNKECKNPLTNIISD